MYCRILVSQYCMFMPENCNTFAIRMCNTAGKAVSMDTVSIPEVSMWRPAQVSLLLLAKPSLPILSERADTRTPKLEGVCVKALSRSLAALAVLGALPQGQRYQRFTFSSYPPPFPRWCESFTPQHTPLLGGVMVQYKSLSFLLQVSGPKVADFCPLQAGAVFTAPARSVGGHRHPRAPRPQVSR
jgi:hypothetical protein